MKSKLLKFRVICIFKLQGSQAMKWMNEMEPSQILHSVQIMHVPCFYNPNGTSHISATAKCDNTHALAFRCKANSTNNLFPLQFFLFRIRAASEGCSTYDTKFMHALSQ